MKKAIYIPTGQNTIIINEVELCYEIFLDGNYKTVPKSDVSIASNVVQISSLDEIKENIFINCAKHPLDDILYSHNTNRLIPENHQYKPLIKFLHSPNNRVLIADEVGLGKTIEAGMIFKEIDSREELRVSLIVVPSSLTIKWQEELNVRFDEYFKILNSAQFIALIDEFDNYSSSKLMNEKVIINYHTLRNEKVMEKLSMSMFEVDFLVMDEAHNMRNRDTSTFESAELISRISDHIIFLTATPVQNNLSDLFNILYLLDMDYFMDYEYFLNMISPNDVIHKTIALIRNGNSIKIVKEFILSLENKNFETNLLETFQSILKQDKLTNQLKIEFIDKLLKSDKLSYIINRTKKKDVGRLIPRNAKTAIVDITIEEQDFYNAVIEFVKFLNPGTPQGFISIMPERMASSSMIASLENFREIRDSGRLFIQDNEDEEDYIEIREEAKEFLDHIIDKGDKIGKDDSKFLKFIEILEDIKNQKINQLIVFSFFKFTLNYLETKLIDLGYKVGKIHGDIPVEERYAKIRQFKNGDFDILLSSEVGSEGLDMQFCNVIVNYDLPWNPMRVEQRIGRIDRIGQKFDKLHIFNLCIQGSIEDRIYSRLYEKLNIFESTIGELEPILGNLEKHINIPELINLTQKEIDEVLHLKELAIKRKEIEIKQQNKDVEKLISDDYKLDDKKENLLQTKKVENLQKITKTIFVNFLTDNSIPYSELKGGFFKISSSNFKVLFNILRTNMSDKKSNTHKYNEERTVLQKIHKYRDLTVSFTSNYNENFQILYLNINSPIIGIITKDKNYKTLYSNFKSNLYSDKYAVIYRVDFKQKKIKSYIKTLIINKDYSLFEEIDYFDFIEKCEESSVVDSIDFESIKNEITTVVIDSINRQEQDISENYNALIDVKLESINEHFNKQINRAKRIRDKVQQQDINRMRVAEIDNLEAQKKSKIELLLKQKKTSSSFEILSIINFSKS
ncbi:helicase-related protein [uncultured Draconibacterium sp.]|uniref:DEAD/DEAH box helicase n=1 Tax=uncultured Draconibacterium sp. TaxID=1573823 RepID=UPI0025F2B919|nr:helicase-related protein [uncultured Draconibacterium sp.]